MDDWFKSEKSRIFAEKYLLNDKDILSVIESNKININDEEDQFLWIYMTTATLLEWKSSERIIWTFSDSPQEEIKIISELSKIIEQKIPTYSETKEFYDVQSILGERKNELKISEEKEEDLKKQIREVESKNNQNVRIASKIYKVIIMIIVLILLFIIYLSYQI